MLCVQLLAYLRMSIQYSFTITGLNRSAFDNKTVSFEEHIKCEHNMWHYLYFIVLVKVKDPTEFTGPESYVYAMVKVPNQSPINEIIYPRVLK